MQDVIADLNVRYYIDPETGAPHMDKHGVSKVR